ELLDHELRSLNRTQDFGRDARPINGRDAELETLAIRKGNDAIELERVARGAGTIVQVQLLSLFDTVLPATVYKDRVHGYGSLRFCLRPKRNETTTVAARLAACLGLNHAAHKATRHAPAIACEPSNLPVARPQVES